VVAGDGAAALEEGDFGEEGSGGGAAFFFGGFGGESDARGGYV